MGLCAPADLSLRAADEPCEQTTQPLRQGPAELPFWEDGSEPVATLPGSAPLTTADRSEPVGCSRAGTPSAARSSGRLATAD